MNEAIISAGARERKCCPECTSISIRLKKSVRMYTCSKCGHSFKVPSKKVVLDKKMGAYTTRKIKTTIIKLQSHVGKL